MIERPTKENRNRLIEELRNNIENNNVIAKDKEYLINVLASKEFNKEITLTEKEKNVIKQHSDKHYQMIEDEREDEERKRLYTEDNRIDKTND